MLHSAWINSPRNDLLFILLPSLLAVGLVLLFHAYFPNLENRFGFWTWLLLIVFIDVAHVYATLFKTYFSRTAFAERSRLYMVAPLVAFGLGVVAYSYSSLCFWSMMAYVAVFHFVRQQYGFMRLYARHEAPDFGRQMIDKLAIYSSTLYPMLFWVLSYPRRFVWFVEDEFWHFRSEIGLEIAWWVYVGIMLVYILYYFWQYIDRRYFNLPKHLWLLGTALSWYVGIVLYNNDLIFTFLNVVTHGIPYMALVYFRTLQQPATDSPRWYHYLGGGSGILLYVAILLAIAFMEEWIWEITIWNDNFSWAVIDTEDIAPYYFLLVPLLSVPQLTHYILDGFIWKRKAVETNVA